MPEINYFAVLAAAVSSFVLGGLWYSPVLFEKVWMRVNGFTQEEVAKFNRVKILGISFVLTLIMALNLAFFLSGDKTDVIWGITAGALAGVGWVALAFTVNSLFENRPWTYILVNGGYQAVAFTIMGAILGAWR